jgi:hypothetical protein
VEIRKVLQSTNCRQRWLILANLISADPADRPLCCAFRSGRKSGTMRNHGRRLMLGLLDNAKYWRSRAEEARVFADSLEDTPSKQIMLGIAGDYERIAELAEQRVKSGGLPSAPWPG